MNFTFSYWQGGVLGNSASTQDEVEVGEWDTTKRLIRVHSNHSQSFDDFIIEMDIYSTLGADFDTYFDYGPLGPLPKDHPGVDLSLYTFDNWYMENGTIFTANTVMSYSVHVYPSWNVSSSLFAYTKVGESYKINRGPGFNLTGDVYIPGWRYKGRSISTLGANTPRFNTYNFGGSLTIGGGIKIVWSDSFVNAVATSLTIEEGVEEVQTRAFQNFKGSGDLIFPSTIRVIGQQSFQKVTLNRRLDISNTPLLKTTGTNAFEGSGFQGDFVMGPSFVSVKYGVFSNIPFNGIVDLSNASDLEEILVNAFYNSKITALLLPTNPKLKTIGSTAFKQTSLEGVDIYIPKTVETIDGQAFGNNKLRNVYIPLSVTYIGASTFYGSTTATFYYEGESIPETWAATWNYNKRPVVFKAVF